MKYYCKYCYTNHSDWCLTDTNQSKKRDDKIITCGLCQHNSKILFAKNNGKYNNWKYYNENAVKMSD